MAWKVAGMLRCTGCAPAVCTTATANVSVGRKAVNQANGRIASPRPTAPVALGQRAAACGQYGFARLPCRPPVATQVPADSAEAGIALGLQGIASVFITPLPCTATA